MNLRVMDLTWTCSLVPGVALLRILLVLVSYTGLVPTNGVTIPEAPSTFLAAVSEFRPLVR